MCVYSQKIKTPGRYRWFIPMVTFFVMLKPFHYTCYWLLWFFWLTVGLFHSSAQILSFYGRCDLIVTPVSPLPTLPSHFHPPSLVILKPVWVVGRIHWVRVGIIRGNPGVFQLYPYPTLQKPLPLMRVRVLVGQGKDFSKPMGLPNSQGYSPNLL